MKIRKEFRCVSNKHCINRCYMAFVKGMSCFAPWQIRTHCFSYLRNWKKLNKSNPDSLKDKED